MGLNFIINVLAQIGLGYWIVFLLTERSVRTQASSFVAILAGYGFWFYSYPLPGPEFDYCSVGVRRAGIIRKASPHIGISIPTPRPRSIAGF